MPRSVSSVRKPPLPLWAFLAVTISQTTNPLLKGVRSKFALAGREGLA